LDIIQLGAFMPRSGNSIRDYSLLTAALEGLELQKRRIDEQIREVRSLLGKAPGRRGRPRGAANGTPSSVAAASKRARLSPAARKRIAAAQKRRWAEYRKSAGSKSE
jgi:hypothetical protein